MTTLLAKRLTRVPPSFIREILRTTLDPSVISFAGGLPKADLFPVEKLSQATQKVYQKSGATALQYSTTRGMPELREWIAQDLKQRLGRPVTADSILITSGSQQALDLIGKVFINPNDPIVVERPGYLGAIQAMSLYEPRFLPVALDEEGINLQALGLKINETTPKLMYTVPSFQNPSGTCYSAERRQALIDLLGKRQIMLVEDDPYGRLRFEGEQPVLLTTLRPQNTILLGSFSKTVAPGLRIGWIYAEQSVLDKLNLIKQATDLHTGTLAQQILLQYLQDNDLDTHVEQVNACYKRQRDIMVQALETYMPPDVTFTRPQGGMFLWVTLPQGYSSMALFELAIKEKVAFVPGTPFFVDGGGDTCLRLNFSNAAPERIDLGIQKISQALNQMTRTRSQKED